MEELVFAAKVDTWFLALFWGGGAAMLLGVPVLLRSRRPGKLVGAVTLVTVGVLFIAVGVSACNVSYTLTADGFLDAHGWPLAGRMMHVDDIRTVTPSSDPRSSHAASLDRLRIDFGDRRVVFIAVHDKAAFLAAIAQRAPRAVVSSNP